MTTGQPLPATAGHWRPVNQTFSTAPDEYLARRYSARTIVTLLTPLLPGLLVCAGTGAWIFQEDDCLAHPPWFLHPLKTRETLEGRCIGGAVSVMVMVMAASVATQQHHVTHARYSPDCSPAQHLRTLFSPQTGTNHQFSPDTNKSTIQ